MKHLTALLFVIGIVTSPAQAAKVKASWYGPGFHGKTTASGERFNKNAYTAAHKTLPFGTKLRLTYKGKSVIVRINDRGPFIKGRTLDMSQAAARKLGCHGVCVITMTKL
jgi:rare lipoprotein A